MMSVVTGVLVVVMAVCGFRAASECLQAVIVCICDRFSWHLQHRSNTLYPLVQIIADTKCFREYRLAGDITFNYKLENIRIQWRGHIFFADHIFFFRRSAFGSVETGDRWENMFYVLLLQFAGQKLETPRACFGPALSSHQTIPGNPEPGQEELGRKQRAKYILR